MKINTINNTVNSNNYKSNLSFKGAANVTKFNEAIKNAEEAVSKAGKNILKVENQKPTKFDNFSERVLKKFAGSGLFNKLSKSGGAEALAYAVVLGNTAKEAVGTAMYTVQAFTNDDLAPDKRKFLGLYDLFVGVISTAISFGVGLALVKGKNKIVKKMLGNTEHLPNYAKAFVGLGFIIPTFFQTIIGKRIIAPAIATPIAGVYKKKLEDKEKKEQAAKQKELTPLSPDVMVLAKAKQD